MALGAVLAVGLLAGCGNDDKNNKSKAPDTGPASDVEMTDVDSPDAGDTAPEEDVADTGGGGSSDTGPPGQEVAAKAFGVLPPIPANCEMPGKRQRLPFYFTTRTKNNKLRPIKPGDTINGNVVEPNRTIGPGTLTTRRMRVSEVSSATCATSSQCTMPLKCGSAGVRGADRYCARQTGVEFIPGTAKHDYHPNFGADSGQLVSVVVENTAMYEGLLPLSVQGKYDRDGNKDIVAKKGRATDPLLKHREAIGKFGTFLATATDPANTKVSLWAFGGQNRVNAQPRINVQGKDHFSDDLGQPKRLISKFPSPATKPSNVYQSLVRVINEDFSLDKYKDYEKFLVLLTDGPNEVWDKKDNKQKVLRKLKNKNIHLFVLHLDSKIDPTLLRDVPTYWQGNSNCQGSETCDGAPPCSDDSDCANFETCRKATIYADKKPSEGGQVQETAVSYCMPDYSGGRLGPIGPYADLACETNGNYLYATEPEHPTHYAQNLPFMFDGQWSVETEFSALDERVGLAGGFYRLSGVFFGLLSPNLSSIMSATSSSGEITTPVDTRGLLRVKHSGGENN